MPGTLPRCILPISCSVCFIALLLLGYGLGSTVAAPDASPRPQPTSKFENPVLWEDLADLDIFRVGDVFYYSASNMHYSPGAPILRSYDLVHWEYVGHSVPTLDFSPAYDLDGGSAYVKGTWASFLGAANQISQPRAVM